MANITQLIKSIREAVYGKDVRESIAASIEQVYEDATQVNPANTDMEVIQARQMYTNLNARENAQDEAINNEVIARTAADALLDTRIDEIIAPTGDAPSAEEVTDARVGAFGTVYLSLGDAIRGQFSNLQNALNATDLIRIDDSNFTTTGYVITATGELSANASYNVTDFIACSGGSKIFFEQTSAQTTGISYAFYESNDRTKFISGARIANQQNVVINIPYGAIYVSFSMKTDSSFVAYVMKNNDTYLACMNELFVHNSVWDNPSYEVTSLTSAAYEKEGAIVANADLYDSKYTSIILCSPGETFRYRGYGNYNIPSALFYDMGMNLIGYVNEQSNSGYKNIVTPSRCYFVRFNSYADHGSLVRLEVHRMLNKDAVNHNNAILEVLEYSGPTLKIISAVDSMMSTRGEMVSVPGVYSKHTVKMPCAPGQIYYYRGYGDQSSGSAVFWNYYNEFIGSVWYNSSGAYVKITVPQDAYYVAFGTSGWHDDCILDVLTEEQYNAASWNVLFDKKWTICGDSFSEGSFASDDWTESNYDYALAMQKVYGYYIGLRNHMELVQMAHSGYAMPDFMTIYQNIPTDSEYITLAFGLNDYSRQVPIGTIDDTESDETFYGYWNTVATWLVNNCPSAKVGLIIMPAYMGAAYRTAEIQIARKYGFAYLNLYSNDSIPMFMNKNNADPDIAAQVYDHWRVAPGNNHPSVACHEFMSTMIENWMRGL